MHPNPWGKGFKGVGAKQCAGAWMHRANVHVDTKIVFTFWGSNLRKALHFFLWGAFSALRGLARKLRWRQRLHDSKDAQLWTVCSCQRFGSTSTSWNLCSMKQKNDMPEATTVLIQPIHWENRIWISSHYLLLLQLANQKCTNNPQQPMKFVQ